MPSALLTRRILIPQQAYYQKVLRIRPDNLILYQPMWEKGGSIAYDLSPQANNGAYTSLTLGQLGIGDGRTAPYFPGGAGFNNIYSAAFAADFGVTAGSISIWYRPANAAMLADGNSYRIISIRADVDNRIVWDKQAPANKYGGFYRAGAVSKGPNWSSSSLAWRHLYVSWDAVDDIVRVLLDGTQLGADLTGLGAWGGALANDACLVGADNTTPTIGWKGWLAHVAIWNVALSLGEAASLARPG